MIVLRNQSAPSEPKTPSGVISFSLGCSEAEPLERVIPIIKPLAGDTKPTKQMKPIVPPLRGSIPCYEAYLGFRYATPQANVFHPCGITHGQ